MGVPYVVVPHVGAFMGFRMLIPTGIWPPGARGPREGEGEGLVEEVFFEQNMSESGAD